MATYFWDFFGPRADGTARHFARHLEQFLHTHKISGCRVTVASDYEGHFAAVCEAPEASALVIENSLRPQRRALAHDAPSESGDPAPGSTQNSS
jgi:hypothetical protein